MIFPGTSAERREGKKEAFMAENKKFVITVGRQYGSGGAEMAKRLGERLGLHVYDKEILKMTSEESGIRESYFHLADEKAGNKLLYRIIHSLIPENGTPSLGSDLISSDNLFRFQSSVIRGLAASETCIIVGRCADYALKDYDNKLNVFIHAPMTFKKSRIQEQYEVPEAKVKDVAIKTDKQRASYYNYYTSKKWGDLKSYDLCIDSSILGIDGTVELIKQAVALKEKNL